MQVGFAAFVWWGLILLVGSLCDFPTVWVRSLGLDSFAGHFRLVWVWCNSLRRRGFGLTC